MLFFFFCLIYTVQALYQDGYVLSMNFPTIIPFIHVVESTLGRVQGMNESHSPGYLLPLTVHPFLLNFSTKLSCLFITLCQTTLNRWIPPVLEDIAVSLLRSPSQLSCTARNVPWQPGAWQSPIAVERVFVAAASSRALHALTVDQPPSPP